MKPLLVPILLSSVFLLCSCSSAVSITASRLSGIIVDTTITVDVGRIQGEQAQGFREKLVEVIRTNKSIGSPGESPRAGTFASLTVDGTYTPTYDERHYEKSEGDETKQYTERIWTSRFDYAIAEKETGDLVIDGSLEESTSDTDEEGGGFWGFVWDIIEAIVGPDPATELQSKLADRFIGEISPHEMTVEVILFEDSDMPELETGISHARAGRWRDALGIFLDAKDKYANHANVHKACYDAGVAYEYNHQYSYAAEFIDRAFQLHPQMEYRDELYRCRRYEQEWKWREGYLEKLRMMEGKQR